MSFDVNKDGAIFKSYGLTDRQIGYLDDVDGNTDGIIKDSVFNVAKKIIAEYTEEDINDKEKIKLIWNRIMDTVINIKFSTCETTIEKYDSNNDGKYDKTMTSERIYDEEGYMVKSSFKFNSRDKYSRSDTAYEYDKNGNLTCRIDNKGLSGKEEINRFQYDDNNRLLSMTEEKDGQKTHEAKFEYDSSGNVSKAQLNTYDNGNIVKTEDIPPSMYKQFFDQTIQYYESKKQ